MVLWNGAATSLEWFISPPARSAATETRCDCDVQYLPAAAARGIATPTFNLSRGLSIAFIENLASVALCHDDVNADRFADLRW
jgi:hypothetical protein